MKKINPLPPKTEFGSSGGRIRWSVIRDLDEDSETKSLVKTSATNKNVRRSSVDRGNAAGNLSRSTSKDSVNSACNESTGARNRDVKQPFNKRNRPGPRQRHHSYDCNQQLHGDQSQSQCFPHQSPAGNKFSKFKSSKQHQKDKPNASSQESGGANQRTPANGNQQNSNAKPNNRRQKGNMTSVNTKDLKKALAKKEIPIHPISYSKLEDLTKLNASDIILNLIDERSGLSQLLALPVIGEERIVQLLRVLSLGLNGRIHRENQHHIMSTLLSSNFFIQHVTLYFIKHVKDLDVNVFNFLGHIWWAITNLMPSAAQVALNDCLDVCLTIVKTREEDNLVIEPEAKESLIKLKKKFIEIMEENKKEFVKLKESSTDHFLEFDEEVPDDFRKISIIPRIEEITIPVQPFLRRNLVQGQYKSTIDYLDTQFRLLREDFIQPLRKGIIDFLDQKHVQKGKQKIKEIRIYEKVEIIDSNCNRDGVSYTVRFDVSSLKRVQWEMSRRLIYGSLVCLSSNNFKSALFATVTDSKPEKLKLGKVDLKFEDEFESKKKLTKQEIEATYVMVESSAYYEAYKYILLGLQNIDPNLLPLQKYIVQVQQQLEPPKYLQEDTSYDVSCIVDKSELTQRLSGCKKTIRVHDLRTWPLSEDLALDDSQRKALHLALTSAMTIIQGPPGTGKTYLGLKIAKILLSNRHIWRQDSGPILVVCYTNHALDQFLEGMLSFTQRLVRVGSRSKNENLQRYNIRTIRQQIISRRLRPRYIHHSIENFRVALRFIRGDLDSFAKDLHEFQLKILHEDDLLNLGPFGVELADRLINSFKEFFDVDPVGESWWPGSFLATWLGLYIDGWVTEEEIGNFANDFADEFKEVIHNKARKKEQNNVPVIQVQLNNAPLMNNDATEDEDLNAFVHVEDEGTAEQMRRMLDNEIVEDIIPLATERSDFELKWAVDVRILTDPFVHVPRNMITDKATLQMYSLMGKARQDVAFRELAKTESMDEEEVVKVHNLWELELVDRWRLYRLIIKKFHNLMEDKIEICRNLYHKTAQRMKEVETGEELAIFCENDVIGMTTTGAAKYHDVLQELNSRIVIVEEAAEVLESHIVTTLAPKTDHLILIGDHQQLRPNPTVYKLAKDFNMDISLFERMIRNNVRFETLKLQHRMRPEISRLLVPHIYQSLEDHPDVRNHPTIKGTLSSVYFISHAEPEDKIPDSTTHSNSYEAAYIVALCYYLLQQNYAPQQITILTTYVGQLYVLRKLMRKEIYEGVRVTVVDNFQGEESDIILLSFVRSSEDGKIGFLNIDNRVNVALSRARHGLFCIGNFQLFATKSNTWQRIICDLERNQMIGSSLYLVCQKHPENVSKIEKACDFKRLAPEGGCLKTCDEELPCGHICKRVCHLTKNLRCEERCGKILCGLGHQCPDPCFFPCRQCMVRVEKQFLNCEHSTMQPCYVDINDIKCKVLVERTLAKCEHTVSIACHVNPDHYKCNVKVEKELPHCKHLTKMDCHLNPDVVPCSVNCDWRLDCGHQCYRKCHPLDDPEHEKIECRKPCQKTVCDNHHKCKMMCYQDCNPCRILVDKILPCGHRHRMECCKTPTPDICKRKCIRRLPCGHVCPKTCDVPCGGCNALVDKQLLYCDHKAKVRCSEPLEFVVCQEKCAKKLSCQHPCRSICGNSCTEKCTYRVPMTLDCGHKTTVPCHARNETTDILNRHCTEPCKTLLPCKDECRGSCGDCRQGRLHASCRAKCGRLQICGHPCTIPCAVSCPPCNRKCSNYCKHSRCPKRCGQPCVKCKEPCGWQCAHERCTRLCGEPCDRGPCNRPCPKKLRCGHPCIGVCGEPCPPLCRICNTEELTEFILYGNETDDDARFVYLEDCKHCIEIDAMDHWMQMDEGEIQMKECPRCKSVIWSNCRYGAIIKKRLYDVQKVKKRVFGHQKKQRAQMQRLSRQLSGKRNLENYFPKEFAFFREKLTGNFHLHQNATVLIENQIAVMNEMAKLKIEFLNCHEATKRFLDEDFVFLIQRLFQNDDRISDFELKQISNELIRTKLYAHMIDVQKTSENYGTLQPHTISNLNKVKEIFSSARILTAKDQADIKQLLESASIRKGLGISSSERVMIVQAIDLAPGHWYKCPNGHIYVIDACGGAMEMGKCNECGAQIGGGNHRLLSDNAHAGEMDGSSHAAWSEAGNMANYRF